MEERLFASRYRLHSPLGKGGMGTVWRATDERLGAPVAVKLLDKQVAAHPDSLDRFMQEAKAAAVLRGTHVVQILDHGVCDDEPYLVMEMLEGESLAARLDRVIVLSPSDAAVVLTQVARAISRAHEAGIVHRDLKPDNIFLVSNDGDDVAKVLDFGIAKRTGTEATVGLRTQTGAMLGTPQYMSPEQASGSRSVDFRTDLWALAVIAYECLLGRRPFEADSLGGLVLAICAHPPPVPSEQGAVPAGFDAWFARGIARDPLARFGSARELAAELRRVCGVEDQLPRALSSSSAKKQSSVRPDAETLDAGVISAPKTGSMVVDPGAAEQGASRIGRIVVPVALTSVAVLAALALGLNRAPKNSGAAAGTSVATPSAVPAPAAAPESLPIPRAVASVELSPEASVVKPQPPPRRAPAKPTPVRPTPTKKAPASPAATAASPVPTATAGRRHNLGI